MFRKISKEQKKRLKKDNAKYSHRLVNVDISDIPISDRGNNPPIRVMRSKDFLVQIYNAPDTAYQRISVCRTSVDHSGNWSDGISWDDLQRIKAEAGFAGYDAVEVYPDDEHIVNVANMRHLWVLRDKLSFKWRRFDD